MRAVTEIKFCGMTRAEDALEAATLGAAYVGVIFAPGPRRLTTARAASVLAAVGRNVRTAGVFSEPFTDTIAETARTLGLRVIQLHGEQDPDAIARLRDSFDGEIWGVIRVADGRIPETAAELFGAADAILLDAHVPGRLGGTGTTLPWSELRDQLMPCREMSSAKLVLAGGLRPENVGEAIRLLRPEIVDVSSGVETAPGIKDHARMRAFRDAVHAST